MKTLDMRKCVADLVEEDPEVKNIMKELGFKQITSKAALKFMGKTMTIPKGSAVKGIPMDKIVKAFQDHGYEVIGLEKEESESDNTQVQKLQALLKRLGEGEDLESVRADFVKEFESVSVHEIAQAEQDMIDEGTPVTDVQKLCDLHSALFHGRTEAEIWEEEEKEQEKTTPAGQELPEGHPVTTLKLENTALLQVLDKTEQDLQAGDAGNVQADLEKLAKVKTLYTRKEQLIMPLLSQMGITGPSDVMWGVDDEIKEEAASLRDQVGPENLSNLTGEIQALTARMREMIYKEENILFPLALEKFSDDQWVTIYADLPEMGTSFVDAYPKWQHGEAVLQKRAEDKQEEIENGILHFPLGELTMQQLRAILDLLPIDITFIDENDINRFFTNEGKVFSRPVSALNRPVFDCHPAAVKPIVKKLLADFKSGKRDSMEVWTPNKETPTRVQYVAVRDKEGKYLGCMELVERFPQEMGKHFH
ncbi:MAG: DUF438 domain-containing protein [Acutalibacteraceae bacterium]